jgi:acyl-CoA thioester hydrolase
MTKTYQHNLEFTVRDYECDLQGIVNNAVYQNYLEHARHEFLFAIGLDFSALHDAGIDPVVSRIEIDYKYSLRSRDRFVVRSNLIQEGKLRFIFLQDIYRLLDEKIIAQARVVGVCVQNGRPVMPDKIIQAIAALTATQA